MATTAEIRRWLRERGEQVGVKGAIPADLVALYNDAHRGPEPIPGPDDAYWDVGELVPDEPDSPRQANPVGAAEPAASSPPDDAGPVIPDEPPAHAKRDWQRKRRRKPTPVLKPVKVTSTVRNDITGQIGFLLQIPGAVWAARDPLCGGTFVQQLPDIAESLTDWVVDSPSLLELFMGPGGSWIVKAVKTAAAVAPVFSVTMAHHVYHTVEIGEAEQAPDQARYAA